MPKLRYLLRLINAFFSRYKGLILISFIFGLLIFLILYYLLPKIVNTKQISIGYVGRYTIDTLPHNITKDFTSGLVEVTLVGNLTTGIAKSWKTDDGGKTWVFDLKDDLTWHDGKPLTSKDLQFAIEDVEFDIVDDHKIAFTLKKPYIPFPVLLNKPIYKKGLIGIGDWVVKRSYFRYDLLERLILKNDGQTKIIKFYPTEEEARLAYKLGEINKLIGISKPDDFKEYKNTKITENVVKNRVITVFFNINDAYLSNKNFRLALNYSIDKNKTGKRAISPINPDSRYFNPQVKSYDYDLERAKELLKNSDVKLPDDYKLRLVSTPGLLEIADEISKAWNELGIKTEVLVTSVIPEDYNAFLTIFDIPDDPDQYSLWHSTQEGTNITHYKNLRIDKLLEDGRVETDLNERQKIYLDFQRFLVEDSPAIFLIHPKSYDIIRYGFE
ncbi:MAG TPA: ABC transporter substrate-binding protein [Patescibacteria group bacterium]|nr:ABC transporter substrate-binding protein [Patescibacteria group bacterium]